MREVETHMYAIVCTGGKQYRVREGDTITVEKLEGEAGAPVCFDEVLLLSDADGTIVGAPRVVGAAVHGVVESHGRAKKIIVFTYKPKKNVRKKKGHRQPFTRVTIERIARPSV
jgi:large subunit ribosomal protein L21